MCVHVYMCAGVLCVYVCMVRLHQQTGKTSNFVRGVPSSPLGPPGRPQSPHRVTVDHQALERVRDLEVRQRLLGLSGLEQPEIGSALPCGIDERHEPGPGTSRHLTHVRRSAGGVS